MSIGNLNNIIETINIQKPVTTTVSHPNNNLQPGFMDYLLNALGTIDHLQKDAAANSIQAVTGNQEFLHNTMIAYEKANIALQLTIEIRNRVIEAYQEIMRIQM